MSQHRLSEEETFDQDMRMKIYSKPINEKKIQEVKIERGIDKEQIFNLIEEFESIAKKVNYNKLDLNSNPHSCVIRLLEAESEQHMEFLLNDFTDNMKTSMRQEDRLVIAIQYQNSIGLFHSRSQETTITSNWTVVHRILDKDNVDRFVIFKKIRDNIFVWYYEFSKSGSFISWLGVEDKNNHFLVGGLNKLYSTIQGMTCAIELSDKDVEKLILENEGQFTIKENSIQLKKSISSFNISQIRVGSKRYSSIHDFLQDADAKRFNLNIHNKKYEEIMGSMEPSYNQVFDDEYEVYRYDSHETATLVRKRNDFFKILYGVKIQNKEFIKFRTSFLQHIVNDFFNHEGINIFHAGMKIYSDKDQLVRIQKIEFYNNINTNDSVKKIIAFYNEKELKDIIIDKIFLCSVFLSLEKLNRNTPISYFFHEISKIICGNINKNVTCAQQEVDLIEYKSGDFLVGKNDDLVAENIVGDLEKKFRNSSIKVYFFGLDEDINAIRPLSIRKYNSDRLGSIEQKINQKLLGFAETSLFRVDISSKDCVIIMHANRLN